MDPLENADLTSLEALQCWGDNEICLCVLHQVSDSCGGETHRYENSNEIGNEQKLIVAFCDAHAPGSRETDWSFVEETPQ